VLVISAEAMPSKVILMMPKNQELSKVSSKDSRIKFQESIIRNNQDQDSRLERRLNQDKY